MAILVHCSNSTEALLARLTEQLEGAHDDAALLAPTRIVVPNPNMERCVEFAIASRLGIAANIIFQRLERFVREVLQASIPDVHLIDHAVLEAGVLSALLDPAFLAPPPLTPVRAYVTLDGVIRERHVVQLAQRLARVLEEYTFARPAMLEDWEFGGQAPEADSTAQWQRVLWRRIVGHLEGLPGNWRTLAKATELLRASPPRFAKAVHVFGLASMAPAFQAVLEGLAVDNVVHVYVLGPSPGFLEDAPEPRGHHPLLRHAGQVREFIQLLEHQRNADTSWVARETPPGRGLLRWLQDGMRDGLHGAPLPNRSVQVLACPGVRREVEVVAEEIWTLIRGDGRIRFHEIAVLLAGANAETYLPHIQSVFHEAQQIPHALLDVPLSTSSRVVEAAMMLVELPFGRFTRPELLSLLMHPGIRGKEDDVDPRRWAEVCDRLGIFHGAERADHAGTYIERDVHNWDQGMKRLVLGQFLDGDEGGGGRGFELGAARYFVERAESDAAVGRLVLLVRALVADARHLRKTVQPLKAWGETFSRCFDVYLAASTPREEDHKRRCIRAARQLAERHGASPAVSYRIAAHLMAAELDGLRGGQGARLGEGVVVASADAVRGVPFRVIFMLGMGEGIFPTRDTNDGLDLRQLDVRPGDVTPGLRDRGLFIDTILSARDRIAFSYVARDERTGDALAPSSLVQEVLDLVTDGRDTMVRRFPLRRFEPAIDPVDGGSSLPLALVEAHHEALARRIGDAVRGHVQRGDALRDLSTARELLGMHWEGVRTLLRMPELPASPVLEGLKGNGPVRLSITDLRRFLECPMHGWARAMLGLSEAEEATESREDEPFTPPEMTRTNVLRNAFLQMLKGGGSFEDLYDEMTSRMEAGGKWPTGILAQLRKEKDVQIVQAWRRQLAELCGDGVVPRRERFGATLDHAPADVVREPFIISVPLKGAAGEVDVPVQISGLTAPLVDTPRGSLFLDARERAGSNDGPLNEPGKRALAAFVENVVMVASGALPPGEHACHILRGSGEKRDERVFRSISQPEATWWLKTVAADLLGNVHGYVLPCESVFLGHKEANKIDGSALVEAVDRVVEKYDGGQTRYAPVRAPLEQCRLGPDEAERMVKARFGLFFHALKGEG